LADGYFVVPYTLGNYLASTKLGQVDANHEAFKDSQALTDERIKKLMSVNGKRTVTSFHRELGHIMWELCGMERTETSLKTALEKIPALRKEFWENVRILGDSNDLNQSLEMAGRVADFLEMGELLCLDALHRNESCGGHFRGEYQTPDGEALRNDDEYAYVAAWQYTGDDSAPLLNKEPLNFEYVHLSQRSYK
jgi:succinate dehydrogenase / fumarate reductase, flavoprotein subunit